MNSLFIGLSITLSGMMAVSTGVVTANVSPLKSINIQTAAVSTKIPTIDMETSTIGKTTYYMVKTEDQLRAIGKGKYLMSYNYILDADISLKEEWVAIGDDDNPFIGSFNGNGFTISNLKITSKKAKYIGLFGCIKGGTIYNVTLKSVDIASAGDKGKHIGAVVALCLDGKVYDNVVLK